MNELAEFGRKILAQQPFSALLGTELTSIEPGAAVLTLAIREDLKQQHGFVHGGVISYLADNALTYAGGSVLGNSVSSEFKINYVRPAIGETLIARASVVSSGKKQAVCECRVYVVHGIDEGMVAVAQGTIRKMEKNLSTRIRD
jgi:uncharacterized protein (TIGR00369 family)